MHLERQVTDRFGTEGARVVNVRLLSWRPVGRSKPTLGLQRAAGTALAAARTAKRTGRPGHHGRTYRYRVDRGDEAGVAARVRRPRRGCASAGRARSVVHAMPTWHDTAGSSHLQQVLDPTARAERESLLLVSRRTRAMKIDPRFLVLEECDLYYHATQRISPYPEKGITGGR